jgi:hypothetical protein
LVSPLQDWERVGRVTAGHGDGFTPLSLVRDSVQGCQICRWRGLCHKFLRKGLAGVLQSVPLVVRPNGLVNAGLFGGSTGFVNLQRLKGDRMSKSEDGYLF